MWLAYKIEDESNWRKFLPKYINTEILTKIETYPSEVITIKDDKVVNQHDGNYELVAIDKHGEKYRLDCGNLDYIRQLSDKLTQAMANKEEIFNVWEVGRQIYKSQKLAELELNKNLHNGV